MLTAHKLFVALGEILGEAMDDPTVEGFAVYLTEDMIEEALEKVQVDDDE